MGILIRETYEIVTPESAEFGEAEDRGWIDEVGTEYTFKELVDLLQHCESCGSWAKNYDYKMDPVVMEVETRSYHPVSERDRRYFAKACVAAGIVSR